MRLALLHTTAFATLETRVFNLEVYNQNPSNAAKLDITFTAGAGGPEEDAGLFTVGQHQPRFDPPEIIGF